jgi:hypothetical protein
MNALVINMLVAYKCNILKNAVKIHQLFKSLECAVVKEQQTTCSWRQPFSRGLSKRIQFHIGAEEQLAPCSDAGPFREKRILGVWCKNIKHTRHSKCRAFAYKLRVHTNVQHIDTNQNE